MKPSHSHKMPQALTQAHSEGRIVFVLACLMLGGALLMFGKSWREHRQLALPNDLTSSSGLKDLRFISVENILDRIRKNEDIHFIDIRPRTSFERNHLLDSTWVTLADAASIGAPTGQLVVIVYGEENTNDELREINHQFQTQQMTFAFLEGGIRNWIQKGGSVISVADPDSFIDQTKVIMIVPEKVTDLRRSLVKSTVIDVRGDAEYQSGHIPEALNIPLPRLEKERTSIPAIGSTFVYGSTEHDTFQAGTQLFDMGYIGVRVISGGFTAWKEKGLPIETSRP